ncbi:MAG: FMN-binding negative transcriptional regulator [Planctomycetota bacterium]|nr:FMN-binding negative transcriptional regulator [Planctomycetota bacterium]
MYIPSKFAETNLATLHEFIDCHSFATLITNGDVGWVASHLPLLLDRDAGAQGKLIGHMARANSQWKDVDGREALVIFHGPHAYISPRWYEAANVVPTWNYVAVHVYGSLHLASDPAQLLRTLRETVTKYEDGASEPWSLDKPDDQFIEGLLDSIVGFEIEITRIEGKWKLSQNHTPERRLRVIDALNQAGSEQQRQVAELMSQTLSEHSE